MDTVLVDGIHYNLEGIEKDCWLRLLNGSLRYKDPLHNPVVANTNSHGVNMRTVVLRKVAQHQKQLAFHTDIRSGKWNDLEQQNNISWLFYDAGAKVQIRLSGKGVLHHNDAIAEAAWAASTISSRKVYLCNPGPSAITNNPVSGLPAALEANDPTAEESIAGRKNFGVVVTVVNWMEWLWLSSKGHRRAVFNYSDNENFTANWLIP